MRTPSLILIAALLFGAGCSDSPAGLTDSGTPRDARPGDDLGRVDAAGIDAAGIDASVDANVPRADGAPSTRPIGEFTDAPGACPAGATRVDIRTVTEMEDASRGDASPDGTCFFVHDGVYTQRGSTLLLYFTRGGSAGAPITWVGESRAGVVIHGRATFEASNLHITNMTFDLNGYSQTGSFNTITVTGDDIQISHLTMTGDCVSGRLGGHIEVDEGAGNALIESSLIERFGDCTGDGHLDHGIYLGAGHDITIRNNIIRENSSRGIQLNTEGGAYGTLSNIVIEQNRIYENGHRDYEDGIVMNGRDTGTITGVTIRYNLFYRNYYSAIRFTGEVITGVVITNNTFVDDGMATSAPGRSAINLDVGTPAATVRSNIFRVERTLVNTCDPMLSVTDNVVVGDASGTCISGTVSADPMFVNAAADDYHAGNPAVASYGAYAP